jgi:hypothetical protein
MMVIDFPDTVRVAERREKLFKASSTEIVEDPIPVGPAEIVSQGALD